MALRLCANSGWLRNRNRNCNPNPNPILRVMTVCTASLLARSCQPVMNLRSGCTYDRRQDISATQPCWQRPARNSVFGARQPNRLSALAPLSPGGARGVGGEWGKEVR